MPKLNDTQLIFLSTAAQRDGGSLLPLPATPADAGDRATKAIAAPVKRATGASFQASMPITSRISWSLITTVVAIFGDGVPRAETMGIVGVVALIANGAVALMLYAIVRVMRTCGRCGFARAMTRSATWRFWLRRWEFLAPARSGPTFWSHA